MHRDYDSRLDRSSEDIFAGTRDFNYATRRDRSIGADETRRVNGIGEHHGTRPTSRHSGDINRRYVCSPLHPSFLPFPVVSLYANQVIRKPALILNTST